jgi:hypothetical protein
MEFSSACAVVNFDSNLMENYTRISLMKLTAGCEYVYHTGTYITVMT